MSSISATFQSKKIEITSIDYSGDSVKFTYRDTDGSLYANSIHVPISTSATLLATEITINL